MELSIPQKRLHIAAADIPYLTHGIFRKGQTGARQMKTFGASGVQVRARCKREIWQILRMEKLVFSTALCHVDSAALVSKIKHISQKEWKRTVGKMLISDMGMRFLLKSMGVACLYGLWKGKKKVKRLQQNDYAYI